MGVLKKHIAGYAIDSLSFSTAETTNNTSCIPFRGIRTNDNTVVTLSNINFPSSSSYYVANSFTYRQLIPFATADLLENFDIDDYQINPLGSTTYTTNRVTQAHKDNFIYNIAINNNTENEIIVNCIRFQKNMSYYSNYNYTCKTLIFSYYLDEPLVIPAGNVENVSINFEIKVE